MALIQITEFPAYGLPKLKNIVPITGLQRPFTTPNPKIPDKMVGRTCEDRIRKDEYFEILDETIRTNPYRKATTAMASVMAKHGIESHTKSVLGTGPRPMANGFPEKKCALTRALKLAQNCNLKLSTIKDDLQNLCKHFEKKIAAVPPLGNGTSDDATPPNVDIALMTGHLVTLIGEAETIARRIYETAVGLHVAEDYLRQPEDLKLLDFSSAGRIQIPNYNFNHASQLCLEWLHSTAIKWLRGFKEEGEEENAEFIKIFEGFTKAVKDYTEAVCLANQVFRVLLYPNAHGKECLQEYIISLGHVLKNDVIMEVQALRRAFDNIQYTFERVGWAASIAWMKYSGKNITVESLNESGIQLDHSTFQHKFYEGPPKTKLKKKVGTTDLKKRSTKIITSTASIGKVGVGDGHHIESSLGKTSKKMPAHSVSKEPPLGETSRLSPSQTKINSEIDGSGKTLLQQQIQKYEEEIPLSRRSRSTPNIHKPKKGIKKKIKNKKPKASQNSETNALENSPTSAPSSCLVNDGVQLAPRKKTYSHSALTIAASMKNSTAAGVLPLEVQQQFNAVFGTRMTAMSVKRVKKVKKIIANTEL